MKDELRNYISRPNRYENIDGTGEIFMGLMVLGFALAAYLETTLPQNSSRWMHAIVLYGVLIPVLGLGFCSRRVIKKHITWPRTGYAAYPRYGKAWWIGIVAAIVISTVFSAGFAYLTLFARQHHSISLPRIGMLVAVGGAYSIWVFRMGKEHWWKWLVSLFMVLGLVTIALVVPGDYHKLGRPALSFVGLVWLGSGVATLFSYIRHTKPPTPQAE